MSHPNSNLLIIKQLFDEAKTAYGAETPFARMKTVLMLDHSIELALNAVIHQHPQSGPPKKRDPGFYDLWEMADVGARALGLTAGLPNGAELKKLHRRRNASQHDGSIPSVEDIRSFVEPVRQFLEVVFAQVFETSFGQIRLWHTLGCSELKTWLDDAAEAVERLGYPTLTCAACKLAFKAIADRVGEVVGPDQPFGAVPSLPREAADLARFCEQLVDSIQLRIDSVRNYAFALGLGVPIADTHRFQRCGMGIAANQMMAGNINIALIGGVNAFHGRSDEQKFDDASFMLEYLGRLSIVLESSFPGLLDGLRLPSPLRKQSYWMEAENALTKDNSNGTSQSSSSDAKE